MDTALKKTVLRLFTYGLYAVTARHGDEVGLMTANWIVQSSFDPPMLALAAEADSRTRRLIEAGGAFAVNVYETGQRELAGQLGRTFAKHPKSRATSRGGLAGQAARCWTRLSGGSSAVAGSLSPATTSSRRRRGRGRANREGAAHAEGNRLGMQAEVADG
jgi:hypothetical protein